jgi:hypothetical protein
LPQLEFLIAFAAIPDDDRAETISDMRTAIGEIWTAGT